MSSRYGPSPRTMKTGWPPIAPKARAGLLTPPGMAAHARRKASRLRGRRSLSVMSGGFLGGLVVLGLADHLAHGLDALAQILVLAVQVEQVAAGLFRLRAFFSARRLLGLLEFPVDQ